MHSITCLVLILALSLVVNSTANTTTETPPTTPHPEEKPATTTLSQSQHLLLKPNTTKSPVDLAKANPVTAKIDDDYYDDEDEYLELGDKILFSEDKPCPRNCICRPNSSGFTVATCDRLEVGTQVFGEDISDLVIKGANRPILLTDHIFKKLGLTQLTSITIVKSTIDEISSTAFIGLHELHSVNLTYSLVEHIPPETFADNHNLMLLSVGNNLLFRKSKPSSYFLNSSSLQELDISNCIKDASQIIPDTAFSKLPNLFYINLSGNYLKFNKETTMFNYLPNLEELDLSNNNLKNLSGQIFTKNSELSSLRVRNNPINNVYNMDLPNLSTLDLSHTSIRIVDSMMFRNLPFLASLNISHGMLEELFEDAFTNCPELKFVDLSYNKIRSLSSRLFWKNSGLDVIKISYNAELKSLPAFSNYASTFSTYLFEANGCSLTSLGKNPFKAMPALTQLHLAHNQITDITPDILASVPRLVDLDLSDNKIQILNKHVFSKNKDLSKINLSNNPLSEISAVVFLPINMLSWLDVSNCELDNLWEEANTGLQHPKDVLKNLHFLNVSNNQLDMITIDELQVTKSLSTLDITENPFECDSEFEELMSYLGENNIFPGENQAHNAELEEFYDTQDPIEGWQAVAKRICGNEVKWKNPLMRKTVDEEDEKIEIETIKTKPNQNTLFDDNYLDDDYEEEDYGKTVNKLKIDDDQTLSLKTDLELIQKIQAKVMEGEGGSLLDDDIDDEDEEDEEVEIEIREPMNVESDGFRRGRYTYLWPILFVVLSVVTVLLIIGKITSMIVRRKHNHLRYTNAILASMHPKNLKKDSGLVYQPLSEEIGGRRTPIISRFTPIVNTHSASYLSSPFHHEKITPERV